MSERHRRAIHAVPVIHEQGECRGQRVDLVLSTNASAAYKVTRVLPRSPSKPPLTSSLRYKTGSDSTQHPPEYGVSSEIVIVVFFSIEYTQHQVGQHLGCTKLSHCGAPD